MNNSPNEENFSDTLIKHMENFFRMHEEHRPAHGIYSRIIAEVDRAIIETTLNYVGGVQTEAAKLLGIDRNTLRKKIQKISSK